MKPSVVVDVGNSRIKWGRCAADRVAEFTSLPHDAEIAWQSQIDAWRIAPGASWALSGTDPAQRDRMRDWLTQNDFVAEVVDSHRRLDLRITVDFPERVGLDRLLNAVAANGVRNPHLPALVIDAGTAITVDWIDAGGSFRGGAIMPGLRLMAAALHQHTALLPLIDVFHDVPLPANNTVDAMRAGVLHAVLGGVERLASRMCDRKASWFLTGGDGPLLAPYLNPIARLWPEMTLEGIRLAVSPRFQETALTN